MKTTLYCLASIAVVVATISVGSAQLVDPALRRALEGGRQRVLVKLAPVSRNTGMAQRRDIVRQRQSRVLAALASADFEVTHRYQSLSGIAGFVSAAGLAKLAANPEVISIDLDTGGRGALADSVPLIDADNAHTAGIDGSGVTVAVIDSGIASLHPDLASSLVDEHCFCTTGAGCCPNGSVTQSGPGSAEDDQGHGTHVAGIITGDGIIAPPGVAPGADIVAVKVLDENNAFCCIADVLQAMDWVANEHPEVKVVNMSLGTNATYSGDCDSIGLGVYFADAVNLLVDNGVSVFVSSMNNAQTNAMGAPACIANANSVGATTKTDFVAAFSNASTTLDLLAPGVSILSTYLGDSTSLLSGTSMASPHAAGTAALLLELSPGLPPADLLQALTTTGVPITDLRNGLTYPRIDADAALAVVTPCGDGIVDPIEECDDGARVDGDGCDAQCRVEICHQCSGAPSVCGLNVRNDCSSPGKSSLLVKDGDEPKSDKLVWRWLKGPATNHIDFGDPIAADDYTLCVFDRSAGVPSLALGARIPAGDTCHGKPCWKQLGRETAPKGYGYVDRDLTPSGIRSLKLTPGVAEKAKIGLSAKGALLVLPGPVAPDRYFDQDANVTVQLVYGDSAPCWEAVFPVAATQRNTNVQFRATTP